MSPVLQCQNSVMKKIRAQNACVPSYEETALGPSACNGATVERPRGSLLAHGDAGSKRSHATLKPTIWRIC